MSALAPITPVAVFSQLFPSRTVFAPRSTFHLTRWALDDAFRLDTMTGITLAIMGNMSLICHQNAATPLILDFFRESGVEPASTFHTYATEEEAIELAGKYLSRGERVAYVYPPPLALEASGGLLVPVSLYNWLNDKASLGHLVDEDYLPPYQMVPTDCLSRLYDFLPGQAVFIKACHPGASGAGKDVLYCPDTASRAVALKWLDPRVDGLSGVRVEQAVEIGSCWCLSLAILESAVRYLGAATQLFSEPARQCGSRIDPDDLPPDSVVAIALAIAERTRGMGYRGIAAFDIGITSAGQPFVFDLNFRIAASTSQVLLHQEAVGRVNARISQSWNRMVKAALAPALERISSFSRCGNFVPIRLYEATPATRGRSVITGMVVAATRAEVESIIAEIQAVLENLLEDSHT